MSSSVDTLSEKKTEFGFAPVLLLKKQLPIQYCKDDTKSPNQDIWPVRFKLIDSSTNLAWYII